MLLEIFRPYILLLHIWIFFITVLYGGISSTGAILVSATAPTVGPKLKVIEKTTMPDATLGVKFQVLAD